MSVLNGIYGGLGAPPLSGQAAAGLDQAQQLAANRAYYEQYITTANDLVSRAPRPLAGVRPGKKGLRKKLQSETDEWLKGALE